MRVSQELVLTIDLAVATTTALPAIALDPELLARFGGRGPRYTSYPTADRFRNDFPAARYERALRERASRADTPLGVYLHVPFCRTICYYCGCNKIGTKHQSRSAPYIEALAREMSLVTDRLGRGRRISHLHFGGGTPTFMLDEEFEQVFARLHEHFAFAPDGEYSIEIDPRTVSPERLGFLHTLGLNRVSLGIQDFDPAVQRAVNRVQPYESTAALLAAARRIGFRSINVDLIYGLPLQTLESFGRTLAQTIAMRPDRIALYHYAHLPQMFKPQRRIADADLPSSAVKAAIFEAAVHAFADAGYVHLGLDHFALPDDELAVAQREGRLHRNFQGYCSHDSGDLVALGVSAISSIGDVYAQNDKTLEGYYARLARGELPIVRGIEIDADDRLCRDAIQSLMCEFALRWDALSQRHGVDARARFAHVADALAPLVDAGACEVDHDGVRVLPRGRLLVRAVAMAFDRYLAEQPASGTYSKIA